MHVSVKSTSKRSPLRVLGDEHARRVHTCTCGRRSSSTRPQRAGKPQCHVHFGDKRIQPRLYSQRRVTEPERAGSRAAAGVVDRGVGFRRRAGPRRRHWGWRGKCRDVCVISIARCPHRRRCVGEPAVGLGGRRVRLGRVRVAPVEAVALARVTQRLRAIFGHGIRPKAPNQRRRSGRGRKCTGRTH